MNIISPISPNTILAIVRDSKFMHYCVNTFQGMTEKANRKGNSCIYAMSIVRELNQTEDLRDINHK